MTGLEATLESMSKIGAQLANLSIGPDQGTLTRISSLGSQLQQLPVGLSPATVIGLRSVAALVAGAQPGVDLARVAASTIAAAKLALPAEPYRIDLETFAWVNRVGKTVAGLTAIDPVSTGAVAAAKLALPRDGLTAVRLLPATLSRSQTHELQVIYGAAAATPQLLPGVDRLVNALRAPGPLRWDYGRIDAAARQLIDDYHDLDTAERDSIDTRVDETQHALTIPEEQIGLSLRLVGLREGLASYGAAAKTPLAFFAGTIVAGGWLVLDWGSPGDALTAGIGSYFGVRRLLSRLDTPGHGDG